MTHLNLADIQGNIVRAYAAYNFPVARYLCLHIHKAASGRAFLQGLRPLITTAEHWERGSTRTPEADRIPRPKVAVNAAISYTGLVRLQVPTRTLRAMPAEFIDGMGKRAELLGDTGPSDRRHWDPVWQRCHGGDERYADTDDRQDDVHILVLLNAEVDEAGEAVPELEERTQWIRDWCAQSEGGLRLLSGHGPDNLDYQQAKALLDFPPGQGPKVTGKEHFGFLDGVGNPVFEGQYEPEKEAQKVQGGGKLYGDGTWAPLKAGEFLLGHVDESQELPPAAPPHDFSRNGTFMAFRKLHQNVASFHDAMRDYAGDYARLAGIDREVAKLTIKAKLVGRWPDGVPVEVAPDHAAWKAFHEELDHASTPEERVSLALRYRNFTYAGDPDGTRCPLGAHIRRANPRDALDPYRQWPDAGSRGSVLNKRRRFLRRGLPYGRFDDSASNDKGEHGIIFIAVCASLFRQFEFVQRQWMEFGLEFQAGSDTCPLVGRHKPGTAFQIPGSPDGEHPPFFCANLPQFVETRGGEYFFVPSITALRMLGEGSVDPT